MDEYSQSSLLYLQRQQMEKELARCNEQTAQFGLTLSPQQIAELCEGREEALQNSGRVEFGEGILPRLILAFCDSPYLTGENYAETLAELQECFYYYKSAAEETISDETLLCWMKETFDGEAEGSLEYLAGTTLEELCRAAREGRERETPDLSPLGWGQYEE